MMTDVLYHPHLTHLLSERGREGGREGEGEGERKEGAREGGEGREGGREREYERVPVATYKHCILMHNNCCLLRDDPSG